jgi:hypothetical protein
VSRPRFKPTKDQRKLVRSLAAIGLRQEHIAVAVGIRSPKTLRKHFGKDIALGTAEATATVAAAACEMAISGDFPGVTRFWLNTVGGGPAMPLDATGQDDPSRYEMVDSEDTEDELSAD